MFFSNFSTPGMVTIIQEGRQEQVLKLQACVTDIDMLQTYGTHTPQQHHVTL
jgi:hypothetical protein